MWGDAATLAELTVMDPAEAAILLDAAGGDMELAVSLHFGDPADAELDWGGEELERVARGAWRGAKPGVVQKLRRESSLVRRWTEAFSWTEAFCDHVAAARESPLRIHEVLGPGSNALVFLMLCSDTPGAPLQRLRARQGSQCADRAGARRKKEKEKRKPLHRRHSNTGATVDLEPGPLPLAQRQEYRKDSGACGLDVPARDGD